jgi:hypothetical protein
MAEQQERLEGLERKHQQKQELLARINRQKELKAARGDKPMDTDLRAIRKREKRQRSKSPFGP